MIKKNLVNIIMGLILLSIITLISINYFSNNKIPTNSKPANDDELCTHLYTVEDNDWYKDAEASSTGKLDYDSPNYDNNMNKRCYDISDTTIYNIANGDYQEISIEGYNDAYFEIIDQTDVVEMLINGEEVVLNSENPKYEYLIEKGDNISIESKNESGIYYHTKDTVYTNNSDLTEEDDIEIITDGADQNVDFTTSGQ